MRDYDRKTKTIHPTPYERGVNAWAREWPLPIGRESVIDYCQWQHELGRENLWPTPWRLQHLAPFQGQEYALGVFWADIGNTSVWVFLLGEPLDENDAKPTDAAFRITGTGVDAPGVRSICDGVRAYWARRCRLPFHEQAWQTFRFWPVQ